MRVRRSEPLSVILSSRRSITGNVGALSGGRAPGVPDHSRLRSADDGAARPLPGGGGSPRPAVSETGTTESRSHHRWVPHEILGLLRRGEPWRSDPQPARARGVDGSSSRCDARSSGCWARRRRTRMRSHFRQCRPGFRAGGAHDPGYEGGRPLLRSLADDLRHRRSSISHTDGMVVACAPIWKEAHASGWIRRSRTPSQDLLDGAFSEASWLCCLRAQARHRQRSVGLLGCGARRRWGGAGSGVAGPRRFAVARSTRTAAWWLCGRRAGRGGALTFRQRPACCGRRIPDGWLR
jgi:hypothetical protein